MFPIEEKNKIKNYIIKKYVINKSVSSPGIFKVVRTYERHISENQSDAYKEIKMTI